MSYEEADRCLSMAQRLATANNDMATYNLAAAISNLMLGLKADFQRIQIDLHTLESELKKLRR